MNEHKDVTIISIGRTGTNYFMGALFNFHEIGVCYEIFNANGAFIPEKFLLEFGRLSGLSFSGRRDPELTSFFRNQPEAAIDLLRNAVGSYGHRYLAYKVFPHQVARDDLKGIIECARGPVIFITRCRLDTFASFKKAAAIKRFHTIDTTNFRVEFDLDNFLSWARKRDSQLSDALSMSSQRPSQIVNYEDMIDCDVDTLVERQLRVLSEVGLNVTRKSGLVRGGAFKQDKARDVFSKFKNGEEVRRILAQKQALDYALGRFMDQVA